MTGRYLVEVKQEIITPVTVEANSQREAIESVFRQQGHAGDSYPGDTQIVHVRRLDG